MFVSHHAPLCACVCINLWVALCRSVLSNTICPYLIFTLLTLEERRGKERRRGEERKEKRGEERMTMLANKRISYWKSPDFKRESETKQILYTYSAYTHTHTHTHFRKLLHSVGWKMCSMLL